MTIVSLIDSVTCYPVDFISVSEDSQRRIQEKVQSSCLFYSLFKKALSKATSDLLTFPVNEKINDAS